MEFDQRRRAHRRLPAAADGSAISRQVRRVWRRAAGTCPCARMTYTIKPYYLRPACPDRSIGLLEPIHSCTTCRQWLAAHCMRFW